MKLIEKLMKDMKENKATIVFATLTILVFAVGIQVA
jgi:hypothetical protein